MANPNQVPKLYKSVVEDVINSVRESFLDEGVDEQVLQELKQLWESKLQLSKAVEGGVSNVLTDQRHQVLAGYTQSRGAGGGARAHDTAQLATTGQPRTIQAPLQMYNPATGTVDMSSAAQSATLALPQGLFQQQLQALQGQTTITIAGQGGTQYIVPAQFLQQPQPTVVQGQPGTVLVSQAQLAQQGAVAATKQDPSGQPIIQLDGPNESSSDDDDEFDNDDDDDDDDENEDEQNEDGQGEEEEPLNSGDDVSEDDPQELFDSENVVVCQFEKINRCKNKWKFHLKDGIMNLDGKDFVFQKANGDAEW